MEHLPLLALGLVSVAGLLLNWWLENFLHNRRIKSIKHRIHVNGIRGKSTVTRILAGILREANVKTTGKTTGSAACLIDDHGEDHKIHRRGAPTILEQIEIVRGLDSDVVALVVECMAIKPKYQQICEDKIIHSNIGVLTNVREDHQEVLGESLEEIARSLLSTCPYNGLLITAEQNPRLLPIIAEVAAQRQTRLIVADPEDVSDAEIAAFPYIAFKENVSIGFELARHVGIDRETALLGMAAAAPDPGVLRMERVIHDGQRIIWADLFAVNDRESVIACVDRVASVVPENAVKVALLNNRSDREHRAIQFARISASDIEFDFIALLGAYEGQVEKELVKCGVEPGRIIRVGEHRGIEGQQLVESFIQKTDGDDVVLFGLVNIHTRQAESLREFFDRKSATNRGVTHGIR